jgi:glucose-1-phosphate cytidylyltransferase
MVEIGGQPILWHIMKGYAAHGIDEFVVCAGFKGHQIKEYFAGYALNQSDITVDLAANEIERHSSSGENWRVTILDTGEDTMTGGRLKRVADYVDGTFCMTYGDCVSDIDIGALVGYHREQGVLATLTAIQPPGRFGALDLDGDLISHFMEKPRGDGGWVNGGFFVLEPQVLDYIDGDDTVWEREPLQRLAHEGNLAAYRYEGYWQNMDTLRDKMVLEEQWASGAPPWKIW